MPANPLIEVDLSRIVIRDGHDRQYIVLSERGGERGFPIVIGNTEADEIRRVVHGQGTERPLTHQLTYSAIQALGARIESVDIVALRHNTYFARLILADRDSAPHELDARPSDAIALALRAHCPIRVAEKVLDSSSEPGN
jgi:bifunctional DNase/RNase